MSFHTSSRDSEKIPSARTFIGRAGSRWAALKTWFTSPGRRPAVTVQNTIARALPPAAPLDAALPVAVAAVNHVCSWPPSVAVAAVAPKYHSADRNNIYAFGVFKGDSLYFYRDDFGPEWNIYGFDSFVGLPEPPRSAQKRPRGQ